MKPISIFYFINFRLVIALNAGFGALNAGLTGIQIRGCPMTLSRGAGKGPTSLPHLENEIRERSQSSQTLEINPNLTDSMNDSEAQVLLLFVPSKRKKEKGFDPASEGGRTIARLIGPTPQSRKV